MSDRANLDKKPLILIVDDEQFMRVIFRDALTEAGFMTTTATDGISAISIFKDMQPDLVLLDLVMPMKDGFETCQDIRSLTEGRYTPILMVTGLDDTGLIHRAFEAGATDFISKPVKPELLVYRVRYMLRASWNVKNLAESEARLARAQEIGHLGNWEWNPFNGTFWWSDEMFRILGMEKSPELPSFESFLFAVYPPDREMVETGLKNTLKNKSTCSFECRIKRSDAELRLVSLHGRAETTVTGKALRLAGTLQDISDLRQVENRLKMLKEAVDSLPIGITLSDINGRIVYSNPAEARMHGYDVEELIGREAREFASNDLRKPFHPEKTRELGVWRRESVNIRKNGEEFPVQLMSMSVLDSESRWLGIVTTCEDISEKKEAEGKIHRLAYFDLLTGLPNRGMFLDRLQQALALAHREGDKVSLIFLDLDNFKDVNDTQGHDFGDKLLCQVAERLSACMRESDTLARLGGDEFVVVLTSVHSHACVAAAAQRILSVFSQPFEIDGRQIYSSASLGIALYPDDCKDASSLFRCADTAMYNAKNEGRSQFRFFSKEMNQKITRRVALENSLRRGLEKKEFFLLYQPQWDLKTSRMVGVEVLLRWQSEDFGLMPPSEFISLTEDSGLIFSIGEWVLRSACIQAKRWAMAGHQDFKVAVNISGKQLKQPDFLAMLKSIIQETGVDPGGSSSNSRKA